MRRLDSNPPGLDCLTEGHILVGETGPYESRWITASWCLWCGAGVSWEATGRRDAS